MSESSEMWEHVFGSPDKVPKTTGERVLEAVTNGLHVESEHHWDRHPWTSPSVLSKVCRRAMVAYVRDRKTLARAQNTDLEWAAAKGTAFHNVFQEQIFGPARILRGGWLCSGCGHIHGLDPDDETEVTSHGEKFTQKVTVKSSIVMPQKCEACGMTPGWDCKFHYIEPMVYDLAIRVVGRIDGILLLDGEEWIIDIKTSKPPWNGVPYKEQGDQVIWYEGLSGIHRGLIIYSKQESRSLKESVVPLQVPWSESKYEEFQSYAKSIQEINDESELPSCEYQGVRFGSSPCECVGL